MIGLKEFIIAAVMNIGVADVNPQIVVADLTNGVHGATHCSVSEEHGLQCKVWIGKDRIKDKPGASCEIWYYELHHCVDKCVAPKIFSATKE